MHLRNLRLKIIEYFLGWRAAAAIAALMLAGYASPAHALPAVDSGDLANQIGINTSKTNGVADAVEANASCGTNLWFLDQFSIVPAQACIK